MYSGTSLKSSLYSLLINKTQNFSHISLKFLLDESGGRHTQCKAAAVWVETAAKFGVRELTVSRTEAKLML